MTHRLWTMVIIAALLVCGFVFAYFEFFGSTLEVRLISFGGDVVCTLAAIGLTLSLVLKARKASC